MSQVQLASDQQNLILSAAAGQYHIPVSVLKGVYALETDSGKNIATSKAGAVGAFQFIPSTAHQYNYPLTNDVQGGTFTQQAYAAAHYLSDLLKQHGGNWDAALKAYSGNGYGLAQVQSKAGNPIQNNAFTGPVGTAINTANTVADSAGKVATLLTSGAFWLRLGEAIAGVILLAMGLRSLTGTTTSPVTVARAVARRVP